MKLNKPKNVEKSLKYLQDENLRRLINRNKKRLGRLNRVRDFEQRYGKGYINPLGNIACEIDNKRQIILIAQKELEERSEKDN